MNYPTRPPPSTARRLLPPKEQLVTHKNGILPMAGTVPAWVEVLRKIKYPTTVVVLDFETFFSADFSMRQMSTIEYVTSPQFEILGLAHLTMDAKYPFADYEQASQFETGEAKVLAHINYLKGLYGPNLEGCTCVFQNARFDASVLKHHFNLIPKYIIDTLCLARNWNARQRNDLDTLTEQWGLKRKGNTEEFKNLTQRVRYEKSKSRKKGPKMPVRVPVASAEQLSRLAAYATNDANREWELFTILLPRISNMGIESRLMRHTLDLFLRPTLGVDFTHGQKLVGEFSTALDMVLEKAKVLCGH